MIRSLLLKNFQKHKKRKVVFDKYVTAIVGRTGSGKSCIVRGLLLALLNRGKGNNKRRKGTCCLRAVVGNRGINRRKGDKVNSYSLDNLKGGKTTLGPRKTFRAFGLGKVPDEIARLVNCQDINFQGQHDQAFWFSLPAGQVSKQLNQIVNLKVIDDTLDRAASEARKSKTRVEVSKERLSEAKKEVERLAWVDEMAADLASLRQQSNDLAAIVIKRSQIADLCLGISGAVSARDLASKAILYARRAVKAGRQLAEVRGRREALQRIVGGIKRGRRFTKVMVPEIETVRNIRVEADKASEDRRALEHLVNQIVEARKKLWEVSEESSRAERRMRKVKICPTCGRKMSSPSSAGTSTCKKGHQSPGRRRTGGLSNKHG